MNWYSGSVERSFQVPALVLWGSQDPWIPLWVAERFGGQKVVYFPDAGHWAPAEVPARAATEIRDFVRP